MPNISLSLPPTWNALTTDQLEGISRILIDSARHYTATGQYSTTDILTRAFFLLTGLRVTSLLMHDDPESGESLPMLDDIDWDDDRALDCYYNCEFVDDAQRKERQTVGGRVVPIRIYLYELASHTVGALSQKDIDSYLKAVERHEKLKATGRNPTEPAVPVPSGPLAWLLRPSSLTIFPYPTLTLPDTRRANEQYIDPDTLQVAVRRCPDTVTLKGPDEMMQDFTWRQYRFCTDFMSFLARCENQLYDLQQQLRTLIHQLSKRTSSSHINDDTRVKRLTASIAQHDTLVHDIRAQFLATLFSRPVLYTDPDTQRPVYAPHFVQTQCADNAYLFKDFPEDKFQVISLWWQGMMNHLQHEFPKVFRREKVGKEPADENPFTLYTRSTTTMVKYTAVNEEEVNQTTYTIILQHINDMAEENDRIKEMNKGTKK